MKADPYSSYVTPLPYWSSEDSDPTADITAAIQSAAPHSTQPWFILPGETISDVTFADYAIQYHADKLRVLVINGSSTYQYTINPSDCIAVKFFAAMLHREVSFITRQGETYHIPYNGVAEDKMRNLLKPFLAAMLPRKSAIQAMKAAPSSYSTTSSLVRLIISAFGSDDKPALAVQTRTVSQVTWGWFRTKTSRFLPVGFGFSDCALALASTEKAVFTQILGECVTLISREAIQTVSLKSDNSANLLSVHVKCTDGRDFSVTFADMTAGEAARKLVGQAQSSLCTWVPMRAVSASDELQRLTGIQLSEGAACAALSQIHNFKWLEAERVGFDTWAVIQPENPLRAAAIHWVRKHLGEFQQSLSVAS